MAGSPINLGLSNPVDHVGAVTMTLFGVPAGWTLSEGSDNGGGTWTVQTEDLSTLTITSPLGYAGAVALQATESWTHTDGSNDFPC